MTPTATDHPHYEIAIIGAGFSGLAMAMELRDAGNEDFVVLERADDLGGTWRDNTYPGCACDIPSVLYSWSKEQNPRWSTAFAGQQEIYDYMRDVVARHDLDSHLRYGHEVLEMRWIETRTHWEIEPPRARSPRTLRSQARGHWPIRRYRTCRGWSSSGARCFTPRAGITSTISGVATSPS